MSPPGQSFKPARIVRGSVTEARLRLLIEHDRDTTGVVAERCNKISRTHYARLIGCAPTALDRFVDVLAEYERDLNVVTGALRHIDEMRAWLTTAYEAGTVGYRRGKVDRAAVCAGIGLKPTGSIFRCAKVVELFDEFDERARLEGYLPSERQQEFDRFLNVLTGQLALTRDRMTINLDALAKAIRVPRHRFRAQPFLGALELRQAEIMAEAQASVIDPYLHGRVFPFSGLAPVWSIAFLKRTAIRFKQVMAGYSSEAVKGPYLDLLHALRWIGGSDNPHCRAVTAEAQATGHIASASDWEEALFAYRDHLIGQLKTGAETQSSVDNGIRGLRIMLNVLSSGGVMPQAVVSLPGVKNARRRAGHLPSLAEAVQSPRLSAPSDLVRYAQMRFVEECAASGTDMGKGEVLEFVDGLAEAFRSAKDLPADPAQAVRIVLEQRLSALRMHASAIVEKAMAAYNRGRELLAMSDVDCERFEREYLGPGLNLLQKARLVGDIFPSPGVPGSSEAERGIANLLAFIDQRHSGIPPLSRSLDLGAFFARRYREHGGVKTVASMLVPSSDAVAAVLTLYLCESGANVSVGRTLDRTCMEVSDLPGHRRITGHKARANGKPIIVELPYASPALRGVEWLQATGNRLVAGTDTDKDRLFLLRMGSRVELMNAPWFTVWFKRFAASTPGLASLKLVPNMIRPSVLLHAALSNEGRLAVGLAIGQHGLAVSQGYQQKPSTRFLYDENIRRFQNAFETLVMAGIDDAAERLGITAEQFEARLGALQPTGLGTFCRNPRGRPDERRETCSTLDCWDDCPHLLIVAEVNAIAALQLWQESLRAAQPEWERDQLARWNQVWLPWLCLTDVVEERMVRGPLMKVWNAARKHAAELVVQPGYARPKPW